LICSCEGEGGGVRRPLRTAGEKNGAFRLYFTLATYTRHQAYYPDLSLFTVFLPPSNGTAGSSLYGPYRPMVGYGNNGPASAGQTFRREVRRHVRFSVTPTTVWRMGEEKVRGGEVGQGLAK